MNFQLTTRNGKKLVFQPELPPEFSKYQVFPKVFVASDHWGTIIFQVVITEEFSIWYSSFLIKEDSVFYIDVDEGSIEFYVVMKNNFDFEAEGFERIFVKEGQFNITHLPVIKMKANFRAGEYVTFDVSFSKKYLQRFTPFLPALENLLQYAEEKKFCHLLPHPVNATPKIKEIVNDILRHEYNDGLGRIYLDSAILQLLTFAIKKIEKKNKRQLSLNVRDMVNAEKVKLWLDTNSNDTSSLSLGNLATRFNSNDYKLRKAFKQLYGTTVFDYLLELRLQTAKKMLEETDKTITEIAYLAGYTSHSHLTHAFKNRFGYPPNDLRKNRDCL